MRRFATAAVPPVRARFREAPEDFEVREVPLYEACGAGTHLYATIEKRGVSTAEAIRRIASRLGRRPDEFGYAGLKDARAIARQRISIEHADEAALAAAGDGAVRILSVERHSNKLKVGHLRGNVFRIALRGAGDADENAARAAIEMLAKTGVPNYFGRQRFGATRAATHLLGYALLREDAGEFLATLLGRPSEDESPCVREARARFEAGDARGALRLFPPEFAAERAAARAIVEGRDPIAAVPSKDREFYVHAAQADLFNRLLDERIDLGLLGRLEPGDVAFIHGKGASFLVEDPAREQPRADAMEISAAGPLFGTKLLAARSEPAAREARALAAAGLTLDSFRSKLARAPRGERRPYRVPLRDAAIAREGDVLRLTFFLPAGCYATAVVSELRKEDVA
jgi:tRNA pseudouridine13 synthase